VTLAIVAALVSGPGRLPAAAIEVSTEPDDPPAAPAARRVIELRGGLAISIPAPQRRAAISADPIAAQVAAGTWTMPRAGDAVTFPGGQRARWEPVKAGADGSFSALRDGYAAFTISSKDAAVMMLEASGHAKVYALGAPRAGDIYETGFVHLPVRLRAGPNEFLFKAGHGRLKARLTEPKASAFLNVADATTPDLIVGEPIMAEAAVVVTNATEAWRDDLTIVAKLPEGPEIRTTVPSLVPLSARKVAFAFRGAAPRVGTSCSLELKLQTPARGGERDRWETLDAVSMPLGLRQPGQTHKRTFRSAIDGSVQYYAVVPALPDATAPAAGGPGLVLTLHGAGVEAIGQAQAYAPKPGLHIVAPTNRRPYGFDWEDWGRLDAIEVLELAQQVLGIDPRRTYLTGHSMGGHGTWLLGMTFPDRFAAIAPSAGWISMWSYAGARRTESSQLVEQLMARAGTPSDTLALARNLSPLGVYILHGDADDNVPVAEARRMRKLLGEFHPDFAYHEQPGAGHWWGSACVDWPPLFAFLGQHTIPPPDEVRRIDFTTASPAVSSRAHWLSVEAQLKWMEPSAVHVELDPKGRRFRGTTENVARLVLDVGRALRHSRPEEAIEVELDGQTVPGLSAVSVSSNGARRIVLVRSGGKWSAARSPAVPAQKGPHRQGPFKEAFRNRFILVVGTKGTPEENAWGLARARFDAESFWYRGNGAVDILTDAAFVQRRRHPEFRDRNVILYGHSESNAAWPVLLAESAVQVSRGQVRIGKRAVAGTGLACLFIRPLPESDQAAVGVVSGTGLIGLRLTERLPYFTSGVAYPDVTLIDANVLAAGSAIPLAAGYFGDFWDVESGEFAWKE
jgi:poly(3-hydroxybutyrate) depolymerase